ncbi:b181826c-1bb4-4a5c-b0cc-e193467ed3d4 [Sclerotinia trifoliorum]|uniref:B181826c-1bb4-4a5c-b0cc-e193467ed3d4 n=1 Tax=Sclerotinia trifoliorum TaxID=28548 RepID=A0A8H2W557_9HELO|nr:b181826c-1bb4-4a5c-b0cc-e193467ed3d4 [Sclerotinia trifoliorum]
MDLNVKSVFGTVRLFAPLLQKAATPEDPSRVIVTASIAGLVVTPPSAFSPIGYSASKAAAIHLTRCLAMELGPRHILCNALSPGYFPSKMADGLIEKQGGAEKLAKVNPHGRLGRPEDIAGAVVYLASRAGSHVNGANLVLDGGEVLGRSGPEE